MDAVELLLLCVTIMIVSPEYLLRLFVVSLVFVFVVSAVSNMGREHGLSDLMLLLSFVVLVVVVRFVLVEELAVSDDWFASLIVSLIGVTLIFVINALADALFDQSLPSII
jgi:hypothetical protein